MKAARTGWYRYLGALWAINLALCIDLLTGRQFFADKADIAVLGFEIPRIAFSFTYSVLFGTFVLWAIGSAKTVREIVRHYSGGIAKDAITRIPEYRLWTLSPINPSKPLRIAFWLLVGDGLFLLGAVTVIHLLGINMPASWIMSPLVYRGIGVISGLIFAFSIFASLRWVYADWKCVCDSLAD